MKKIILIVVMAASSVIQCKASGRDSLILKKFGVSLCGGVDNKAFKGAFRGEIFYKLSQFVSAGISYTSVNQLSRKFQGAVSYLPENGFGTFPGYKSFSAINMQALDFNLHFSLLSSTSKHIVEPYLGFGMKKVNTTRITEINKEYEMRVDIQSNLSISGGLKYSYKIASNLALGLHYGVYWADLETTAMFGPDLTVKF
ncbi:MAG: hypothetical protein H7321_07375 [Bacteroidia bacterium]|nr:hypothetical protein [Bacteroidia bacterium]